MIVKLPYGTFELVDEDNLTAPTVRDGFWDPALKPYLDRVEPLMQVVDVGAHVGLYSGYLASRGARVVAFEGHPRYLELLRTNVARNVWEGSVTVIPIFLYSYDTGLTEVHAHDTRASNTWIPSTGILDARATTLDAAWWPQDRDLHVLKVDAQGADLCVLLGAEGLIRKYRPLILIEFEADLAAQHGHTAEDYHHWARKHAYREEMINGWNCCLVPE